MPHIEMYFKNQNIFIIKKILKYPKIIPRQIDEKLIRKEH